MCVSLYVLQVKGRLHFRNEEILNGREVNDIFVLCLTFNINLNEFMNLGFERDFKGFVLMSKAFVW